MPRLRSHALFFDVWSCFQRKKTKTETRSSKNWEAEVTPPKRVRTSPWSPSSSIWFNIRVVFWVQFKGHLTRQPIYPTETRQHRFNALHDHMWLGRASVGDLMTANVAGRLKEVQAMQIAQTTRQGSLSPVQQGRISDRNQEQAEMLRPQCRTDRGEKTTTPLHIDMQPKQVVPHTGFQVCKGAYRSGAYFNPRESLE